MVSGDSLIFLCEQISHAFTHSLNYRPSTSSHCFLIQFSAQLQSEEILAITRLPPATSTILTINFQNEHFFSTVRHCKQVYFTALHPAPLSKAQEIAFLYPELWAETNAQKVEQLPVISIKCSWYFQKWLAPLTWLCFQVHNPRPCQRICFSRLGCDQGAPDISTWAFALDSW